MPTMTREQWLEKRRQYIGGSDAAAAIGLSRFKTQLKLWQEKRGATDDEPTEAMIRGQMLEPLVRHLYAHDTSHETADAAWVVSAEVPFMAATPDLLDVTLNSLVQLKTASAWTRHQWGPPGSSEVPIDYMIQAQHEMAVVGAQRNKFGVLFADNDMFRALVWMVRSDVADGLIIEYILEQIQSEDSRCEFSTFPIARDDEMISQIVEGERAFWQQHIEDGVVPPDASIPEKTTDFVTADANQRRLIEGLQKAEEDCDVAETRYDQFKAQIIREIGENAGMIADGLAKIHYKAPAARAKTDWESIATQMRVAAPEKYDLLLKEYTKKIQPSRAFRAYWK